MSAIGTKRTSPCAPHMSAFGGNADMVRASQNVRLSPIATLIGSPPTERPQNKFANAKNTRCAPMVPLLELKLANPLAANAYYSSLGSANKIRHFLHFRVGRRNSARLCLCNRPRTNSVRCTNGSTSSRSRACRSNGSRSVAASARRKPFGVAFTA